MHIIFCIWPVRVPLTWLLLSFGMTPMNADSFFTSWHDKIFQVYIGISCTRSGISHLSQAVRFFFLWKWYLETTVWELGVLLATELITTSRTFVWAELGSNFLKNKIHYKYIRFLYSDECLQISLTCIFFNHASDFYKIQLGENWVPDI